MDIESEIVQARIKELNSYLHTEFDEFDKNSNLYEPKQLFTLQLKIITNCYEIIEEMIGRKLTYAETRIYF